MSKSSFLLHEEKPAKAALRASRKQARAGLTAAQREALNRNIVEHLLTSGVYRSAQQIGTYSAHRAEVSLEALGGPARRDGRSLFLPVVDQPTKGHLRFGRWDKDTQLTPNRWGIPEPPVPWVGVEALSALLVPLVAFDRHGNRIGMGGGYYDRTLAAAMASGNARQKPELIGVAYECQKVDPFTPDPWDIPLDWILTENGIRSCQPQPRET